MVKEVEHLTMVLVLDEDHTHYSDAFGNIFESSALSKKRFPEGSDSIKTKKGGPARVIMCHFCPHACSNDDYAYRHLAAIHLNIQWGVRNMLWIREQVSVENKGGTFSLIRRGAPKSSPAHHVKRLTADIPTHPRTGWLSDEEVSAWEPDEEEEEEEDEECSPSSGVSSDGLDPE